MPYPLFFKADFKLYLSVFILILVHFSGLIGFHTDYRDWFLSHTPLNLVLATFLLLINQRKLTLPMVMGFAGVFLAGFAVEVVGVNTGAIFGTYYYGDAFGPKLLGVPVLIGINWAALCFAAATVVYPKFKSLWSQALVAAAIPVSIDFLIERVCEIFDFWYWQNSRVPLQNFVAWYICSFLFILLLIPLLRGSRNPFAIYFLAVQFLFFLVLNITFA